MKNGTIFKNLQLSLGPGTMLLCIVSAIDRLRGGPMISLDAVSVHMSKVHINPVLGGLGRL